jgi:hypothetical protein
MARRSEGDRILDMVRRDARLRVMPRAAAMLWLDLVLLIKDHGADGVLRLGSTMGLHFGSWMEVAFTLRMPETELETHVAEFARRGLITVPDAACVMLPADLMPSARALAARLNGKKGGRPPKIRAAGAQGEILLPIAGGGAAKPTVTHGETQEAETLAGGRAGLSLASKAEAKLGLTGSEINEIGREAFAAAGFDDAKDVPNWGVVHTWVGDGADRALILSTIEAVMERGVKPNHLGYFSKAIAEAIAKRPVPPGAGFAEWEAAFDVWVRGGQKGAEPKLHDFKMAKAS